MKRRSARIMAVLLLASAASFPGSPARADVAPGFQDFEAGRLAEAVRDWSGAAEAGDAQAALLVGAMYDHGYGVPHDDSRALSWYRRAAEAGDPVGMLNVAVMYDSGRGVPADRTEAARWYERAAQRGSARAEYDLALLYEAGDGVPRDTGRAVTWFRAAARDGLAAARSHLASLGRPFATASASVPAPVPAPAPAQDASLARFYEAQKLLLGRSPAQMARAVELFRTSAEAGNTLAAYDLAYCLDHGIGTPADHDDALHWYEQVAERSTDPAVRAAARAATDLEGHSATASAQ